ncbi:WD repeat-containing protein 74-like [Montipora foliosa]|uniref:WD repeat-containing protein 74-like n=1 Tax=Montipora foliosa TaxID=591990 RepID=UPI0035F17681
MADVWVGSETGLLKGIDLKKGSFTNYNVAEKADRKHSICSLSWVDEDESQMILGSSNGIVKTFDVTKGEFVAERSISIEEEKLKGLFQWDNSLVTCVDSGLLQIWTKEGSNTDVKVGSHISVVRQNPSCSSQVGTGGQKNDLKVWDLNRPEEPIFRAKNVRNDFLDLHVPIWVTDIGFLPNQGSQSKITVGTGYHQVRLYDTKTQRRPVLSVDFGESPISALAVTDNEHVIIVGNTVGSMGSVDLRKGQVQGHYKGFAGAIRCISCLNRQQMVASCGLDKFFRIHDLNSRKILHKVYLKSALNCLLFSSKEIEKNLEHHDSDGTALHLNKTLKRTATGDSYEDEDANGDDVWDSMEVITSSSKRKRLHKSKS